MRLTAKPRYLLLHHRGKEKSNTVTALLPSQPYISTYHLYSQLLDERFSFLFAVLVEIIFMHEFRCALVHKASYTHG